MLKATKGRKEFYEDMRTSITSIKEHSVWAENDYLQDPFVSAEIMTSLASQLVFWYRNQNLKPIEDLLLFLESGYEIYSDEIMSYVYTDFLPTIITTSDSEAREYMKSKFGYNLCEHYEQLIKFGFYSETK